MKVRNNLFANLFAPKWKRLVQMAPFNYFFARQQLQEMLIIPIYS